MPQWEYVKLVAMVHCTRPPVEYGSGDQWVEFSLQPVRTQAVTNKKLSEHKYGFQPETDKFDPVELVISHADEHICRLGLAGWELITMLRHGDGGFGYGVRYTLCPTSLSALCKRNQIQLNHLKFAWTIRYTVIAS